MCNFKTFRNELNIIKSNKYRTETAFKLISLRGTYKNMYDTHTHIHFTIIFNIVIDIFIIATLLLHVTDWKM